MPPFLVLGTVCINHRTGEQHAGDVGRLGRVTRGGFLVEDGHLRGTRTRSAVFLGPGQAEKAGLAQAALPIVKNAMYSSPRGKI